MSMSFLVLLAVVELVDPFWGSGATTSAPSEGMSRGWNWEKAQSGNTHPGAVLPFGWVSACGFSGGYTSGYGRIGFSGGGPAPVATKDIRLFGFTHFHHNGSGWIGEFLNYCLMTPSSGGCKTDNSSAVARERAEPGYYAAELSDYAAEFELTVTRAAACHRYRFLKPDGRLKIDVSAAGYRADIFGGRKTYAPKVDDCRIAKVASNEWAGEFSTMGVRRYFHLSVKGDVRAESRTETTAELAFGGSSAETAIAFSVESQDDARRQCMAACEAGFDAVRKAAADEWSDVLSGIKAEFPAERERRRFYSALYQSLQKPVEYRPGRFAEFSTTWDIYRAQLPLVFSFASRVARPIALSVLRTSEELGYSPNNYPLCKRPDHNDGQATALGVYVLSDACFRGLLTRAEYPRMKAFFDREFASADISRRSVSHVLDVAGAYRAAAFVAERFGDAESAKEWKSSAEMWRRAYDAETGLLPKNVKYYEGDERNYSFRPHVGMNDRVALAGGAGRFESMLNDFFAVDGDFSKWTPDSDRRSRPGHFEGLNNECDMNSPLAWFWVGRADRVCEVHDLVRRCRFSDGEGGLPGNNDGGGTSAWYVWSCLGIYPLSGTPYVFVVSPAVDRAEVRFAQGRLTIEVSRESGKSIYPSELVFNGKRMREPWMLVSEIEKGGVLSVKLADRPSGRTPIPRWL
jgi:putative alpha-1,2-mannosidase